MRESPGATKLIPVVETTFPFFTTHGVPLKLLAEQILAKSDVSILAIQPKNTDFGEELSEEIRGVADSVSDFITNLLKERRQ
jgi:Ni,Fe-hydrogenase maturation factor